MSDFFDTEYSQEFDEHRKARVAMSYYKYGTARINFGRHYVNALGSMRKAIDKYLETRNKEYLCDAANYLMFEFMFPSYPGVYFKPTSSEESAGLDGISIAEIEEIRKNDEYFQMRLEDDLK